MAHIAITSAAYWGDVMPFVPVAEALSARGHRVSLVVPEGFHEVLAGGAFELIDLGTPFSPRELAAHGEVMERANTVRGVRDAVHLWVGDLLLDRVDAILGVLDGVAPDIWVAHNTLAWLVELAASPTDTPLVVGHLFPMMIPSAQQSPPTTPLPSGAPEWAVRVAWRVGRALTGRLMFDDRVNALRIARGLPAGRAVVGFGWEDAARVLLLTSPLYWPAPPDWPSNLTQTGFTVWGDRDDPLPPDLHAHLHTGDPPVLVTLGTSAAANARDAFTLAAQACDQLGRRVVMLVGNDRNAALLGERDDVWAFAPIRPVLDRCAAVVHAAGHGTLAAAATAGVPQVVMPQAFDQMGHAARLAALGVGVTVPWRRRSADRLAAALSTAMSHDTRSRARTLAARLAEEDGPATAAAEIERVLARS